mmetsp:Transcript_18299/g.46504  ORF Transcript_18299/g.46504 Transcript_18299/m.46504 type:complete len:223 (+) Transcript_18299:325-993(+)
MLKKKKKKKKGGNQEQVIEINQKILERKRERRITRKEKKGGKCCKNKQTNTRTTLRNRLQIVALEDNLRRAVGTNTTSHGNTLEHGNATNDVLTKEVTDLNHASLRHSLSAHVSDRERSLDGEMGIHEAHLETVAIGNSNDHVLHVCADSAHAGSLSTVAEPEVDAHAFLADHEHVTREVLKVTNQRATRASDGDLARGHTHGDTLRDFYVAGTKNLLHCFS